jgi:hypothetical protein
MKKKLTRTHKKNKYKKISIRKKYLGGDELPVSIFNKIVNRNIILNQLQTISSGKFNNDNKIITIRNTYSSSENIKEHLYDFIFDLKTKKLIKIWDHDIGKLETITAGLPGIHIYATLESNDKSLKNIIGTFVRL